MGTFFGTIYCWFEDLFGLELANYMWGQAATEVVKNQYIGIGLWMLGISLAMTLVFYYLVNNPKLNHWWGWGIFLTLNAVINFIMGWQWVLKDLYEDKMVSLDPSTGTVIPLNIGESDCLCFGVANMILSILAFCIFSLILKWGSRNCSNAPF